MRKSLLLFLAIALAGLLGACQTRHQVKLEPVEVKPIHITIDVNVKVAKALDDFFGDIDQAEEKIEVMPGSKVDPLKVKEPGAAPQ